MTNRLFVTLGLAGALLIAAAGCDLLGGEEDGQREDHGWVAMTAVYAETDSSGAPVQRIVLADFDNPSDHKVLAEDSITTGIRPRFSPRQESIVFEDRITGLSTKPYITLINPISEEVQHLYFESKGNNTPLLGKIDRLVWSPDGRSFYDDTRGAAGFGGYIYHYGLSGLSFEAVGQASFQSVTFPIGFEERDTLIVFSDAVPGHDKGYFLMDQKGNYLTRIENPHLEQINRKGVNKKAPYFLTWNAEQDLFAYSQVDSTVRGYKIAVTNLDGSYYRTYTSGNHIDGHPRWGPDGQYILFDRREPLDYEFTDYKAMVLDLETGEVREFVKPEVIDGAVALRFPDY